MRRCADAHEHVPSGGQPTAEGPHPQISRARKRLFVAVTLLLTGVFAEAVAWPVSFLLRSRWAMYAPPKPDPTHVPYDEYLRRRDPVLGWPAPDEIGAEHYDTDASRWCRAADLPVDAPWLVSLYGDSYTADYVGGHTDHWGCRMQRKLGARVENFGVGGYGTDQSYLRYLGNDTDAAQVVVLGHMSENLIRNLTRYRDFHTRSRDWAFKPRFVLSDAGELQLLPLPALDLQQYRRLVGLESPQLALSHENFHPGGPTGAVPLRFPAVVSLIRNFGYWELRARLRGLSRYAPFYDPDHALGGVALTAEIMRSFQREAERRGQRSLLVIFPGPDDMAHHRETGVWIYQSLIDALERSGLSPYNFGDDLAKRLEAGSVDSAFHDHHYTLDVSHFVADRVAAELVRRRLLPGAHPAR